MDVDKTVEATLRRNLQWLDNMDDDDPRKRLFCEHGHYVGYKKSLSFKCKGCVDDNNRRSDNHSDSGSYGPEG